MTDTVPAWLNEADRLATDLEAANDTLWALGGRLATIVRAAEDLHLGATVVTDWQETAGRLATAARAAASAAGTARSDANQTRAELTPLIEALATAPVGPGVTIAMLRSEEPTRAPQATASSKRPRTVTGNDGITYRPTDTPGVAVAGSPGHYYLQGLTPDGRTFDLPGVPRSNGQNQFSRIQDAQAVAGRLQGATDWVKYPDGDWAAPEPQYPGQRQGAFTVEWYDLAHTVRQAFQNPEPTPVNVSPFRGTR